MSNVYCKNCSYFECTRFGSYCTSSHLGVTTDYIFGSKKNIVMTSAPNYPNNKDTNGCTYYKRKWWKFWIKE